MNQREFTRLRRADGCTGSDCNESIGVKDYNERERENRNETTKNRVRETKKESREQSERETESRENRERPVSR